MSLTNNVKSYIRSVTAMCGVLCLCQVPVFGSVGQGEESAAISFRISREVLHEIDPRLFGQFMERPSWGEIGVEGAVIPGTGTLRPDVLKLLLQMEIPIIRFPGGTDADFLDWRDMIDNVPGRSPQRPISTGHRGHKVTNHFGYDEFLQFCERAGAEAILVVNFRDALLRKKPLKEAAMHVAALAAYCNAPVGTKLPRDMYDWPSLRARNGRARPYKVKYFQIGNETWAFIRELREIMSDAASQHYVTCLAAYIEAIRSVDPSIEIIVDGHDGDMSGITKQVYEQVGDKVSYFATHFYCPWAITKVMKNGGAISVHEIPADEIWYAWVAVTQFDANGQSILRHSGINTARDLGYQVAVTEWNWNGWWRFGDGKPALDSSFAKGLGAAGYLHAFMRAGDVIELGCQSMLVGNSWGITSIRADATGKIPPFYMPTGLVTMFYSQHHGADLLALESGNVPTYGQPYQMGGIRPEKKVAYVDALATANREVVYFHAINRHFSEPLDVAIDVSAFDDLGNRAVHHLLEGRLNDAPKPGQGREIAQVHQKEVHFDGKILKVRLPRRSVSCFEFSRR